MEFATSWRISVLARIEGITVIRRFRVRLEGVLVQSGRTDGKIMGKADAAQQGVSAVQDSTARHPFHNVNEECMKTIKTFARQLWFQLFARKEGDRSDSCGFEQVFVGETPGKRLGLHNVIFYLQEKRNQIDKGYVAQKNKARGRTSRMPLQTRQMDPEIKAVVVNQGTMISTEINDHVCSRAQGKGCASAIAPWHSKDDWILERSKKYGVRKCICLVTAVLEIILLFCLCFQPDKNDQLMSIQFSWKGSVKPIGSTFTSVSLEFEFALYTVIFLLAGVTHETVKIEEYELQMVACCHGQHIGTAYPVLVSISSEVLSS
ncbi:LOW QUALITY PROTEIN: uridylate-specific endoribonuclease C-like [Alca torda]